MKRKRTYFIIDDLVFEVEKPEIMVIYIKKTQVKIENEEYKELRKEFNEDVYHIVKTPDGWVISEKE